MNVRSAVDSGNSLWPRLASCARSRPATTLTPFVWTLRHRRPFDDCSVVGRVLFDDLALVDVPILNHLL